MVEGMGDHTMLDADLNLILATPRLPGRGAVRPEE
jgi:hypothetical protein